MVLGGIAWVPDVAMMGTVVSGPPGALDAGRLEVGLVLLVASLVLRLAAAPSLVGLVCYGCACWEPLVVGAAGCVGCAGGLPPC